MTTFQGTYTMNRGADPVALAHLDISPDGGEPFETAQCDAAGHYSHVSTSTQTRFAVVEQWPGGLAYVVTVAGPGAVVDTSRDIGPQASTFSGNGHSDHDWWGRELTSPAPAGWTLTPW